jgi:Flp pilus assembly protein TadD
MKIMPQDSAIKALPLVAALLGATMATAGCRSKPIDRQALLTAHYLGLADLERGLLADAETQFKTVVANAPKDPLGYANLGLTYLRGGRFGEAEAQLKRARRLDPTNPEVALIAAKLYALTGRAAEARATLEALPRDAKVLYALARLDSLNPDRLRDVLTLAPANLAVHLELIDLFARRGDADSALRHLEQVRRLRPESPPEAKPYLDRAVDLLALGSGQIDSARAAIDRFVHSVQLTAPYQAALRDVAWTEGPLVGRPVLAFNPQTLITTRGLLRTGRQAEVQFTDVTGEAGLTAQGTALASGDYDGDGEDNLFVAPASFYRVRGGFIANVSLQAGVAVPASTTDATFADFDNDGWLDLFALGGDGRGYLFRNDGTGQFTDVTATARVGETGDARKALFVDLDHDGDLDLLLVGETATRVYRNNLDGTFTLSGGLGRGEDAAFGDFDGDGRTDIFVGDTLYHNVGAQSFRGTAVSRGSDVVAAGDYDNDGSLDLFVLPDPTLWHNGGDGTFTREARSGTAFDRLRGPDAHLAEFIDYDNDGWLDLVTAGTHGVSLFHNDHAGRFSDRTTLLPASVRSRNAVAIVVSDVDGDGDQDLFVAGATGVHLLRNDGGNASLGMDVQLTALRTGSGKNNTFGIGSRIEVRAGEIYQTRIATERVTHFGLGPHLKADVLRVEWTNGVPQTVFFPGTDADVLELEQLKGSCAFLYTWDGKQFRFITDVMWQSALGMPVGIMGTGARAYAPAGASREYLRIPGDALEPRHGRYVLQVTEELWETAYLDEVKLLAVDHPDSVDVFVDERFPPPGGSGLRPFQAVDLWPPVSATDERGTDLLPALRRHDDAYVANLTPTRYQGVVEPHDLILDLGDPAGRLGALLFLRGWIYPSDASINVALSQAGIVTRPPSLEVRDAHGRWVTAIPNIGFPSGKDKTVIVDLAGRFPTSDHHVRIRTNLQIYWDQVFVAHEAPTSPMHLTTLTPASADLHYRGFSRMYRRGGRYGPHWFAYDDVSRESPWRTIEGAFTRFGDVLPLAGKPDDRYVIMAPGDETTLEFTAPETPLPPGWRRTFLLYTDGWIKDADLHTAYGDSVAPLPFHAIQSYPYAPGEAYPADSAHLRYLRQYNTRLVRNAPPP